MAAQAAPQWWMERAPSTLHFPPPRRGKWKRCRCQPATSPPAATGKNLAAGESTDRDGQKLDIMSQRVEIVDESLSNTLKRYPHHLVNGVAMKQKVRTTSGEMKDLISPSLLVVIPRCCS